MISPKFELLTYNPEISSYRDSYVLKHEINYNTSCEDEFDGVANRMIFTDYDLARKTQPKNAETFNPLVINLNLENINAVRMTHYDEDYYFGLYGHVSYVDDVNSDNMTNDDLYHTYYVEPILSTLYYPGDHCEITFNQIVQSSGETEWEHIGKSGDYWVVNGVTDYGNQWEVSGVTDIDGFSSGTTEWYLEEKNPVFSYIAPVVKSSAPYLKFNKLFEDYMFNNLLSNFTDLVYEVRHLHIVTPTYGGINYGISKSIFGDYFDLDASPNDITITPKINDKDLYFDYGNMKFEFLGDGDNEYQFTTKCTYSDYKLEPFMEQLGYPSGDTIHYDILTECTSLSYQGEDEFKITIDNIDDLEYINEYTYVNLYSENDIEKETPYISLITNIDGDTITILASKKLPIGTKIGYIENLSKIGDISKMLYECYINIEGVYEDFYDGNVYDPNILGPYVIDPNLDTLWVFDPNLVE